MRFAKDYGCDRAAVVRHEALDERGPNGGSVGSGYFVSGCGKRAYYTCRFDDDPGDVGAHCHEWRAFEVQATTGQTFAGREHMSPSPEDAQASAAHASALVDLACAEIRAVSATIYEGCGQRATYQVVANANGADRSMPLEQKVVLVGKVPLYP